MVNKTLKTLLMAATVLTSFSAPVLAQEGTHWLSEERFQFRLRAIGIAADGDGTVAQNGLRTDVENAFAPEFDVTYYLTNNVAMELIAATAKHDVDAGGFNLGDAWILPPTLTLQYHFTPDQKFSPYVGVGLNYSYFYGEDDATGFNNLDVDGGFGYAFQIGADYWINDNWGINFDLKYVKLDVDVDVNLGGLALDADDVGLDPFIIGAGVSYRF